MSVAYEGFRKNREPITDEVEEVEKKVLSRDAIGLSAMIGGTIFLTTGVAFALGLPWAAITLGLLLIVVGFVLGFHKDN